MTCTVTPTYLSYIAFAYSPSGLAAHMSTEEAMTCRPLSLVPRYSLRYLYSFLPFCPSPSARFTKCTVFGTPILVTLRGGGIKPHPEPGTLFESLKKRFSEENRPESRIRDREEFGQQKFWSTERNFGKFLSGDLAFLTNCFPFSSCVQNFGGGLGVRSWRWKELCKQEVEHS